MLDARARGDFEAVAAGAGKLLSGLGADASELGAAGRRTFALLRLGVAQTWLGELEAARTSLEEALALALHGSREYLAGNALAALGVLHVRTGDLRRARESGARALSICERHDWSNRRAGRDARFALATCAHHQGRGAEARRHLDALAAAAPLEPALGAAVRILGARVSLREGEPEAARIALASLRRQSIEPTARAMWFLGLAQTEAEALCALGSGEEAQAAVASDPGATALDGKLVASRLALAAGHPELVTSAEPAAGDDAAQNVGAQIELRALAAVAHHQRGDDESALALTERALELAEPDGRVEPFLAVGRPIRELLSRRIRAGTAHRSLAGTVIEQLDPRPATPAGEARTLLLEPLSERELAVLRYLPTPLSKAEIAAEMFVTVNTVKTHVKSIYRKLDVGSRVEAVRRARTLALI
jgi:LuxR family maltose regulon positive regulatory protein